MGKAIDIARTITGQCRHISRDRAAHQQLWGLQQCNKLTVIFQTTEESQPGNSPLYLVFVRERCDKSASSPRLCEATHKSAYPESHHKATMDCPASSTLQPESGSFRLPYFQSLERCNLRKEVFEDDEEVISLVKRWRPAE
jgi:hypothetical protein